MKKSFFIFIALLISTFCFAEGKSELLYSDDVYGQTFTLWEFSDETGASLWLFMYDNKTKQTRTYDSELPTEFCIITPVFTNPSEYAKAVEKAKSFFNSTLNFVYLADMKDICDIAPCCDCFDYCIDIDNDDAKYISISYFCDDLDLLDEIANAYNRKGRVYCLETYVE